MSAGPAAWSVHGGRIAEAAAHFGGTPDGWLDLSTGVNPVPWPGAGTVRIDWQRLPGETDLARLEEAAALHFGVDRARLCALPGSELGLRLIGRLIGGPARHVAPGYRTHGEMIAGSHAIARDQLDRPANGTLILANPSNPDGRILPRATIEALLDRVAASSGWLIVDEAFADAAPEISLAPTIDEGRPLILLRSFGKFFGLPGLRLGFLLGPAAFVARVRALLGSWPLSSAALAIGTPAYRDRAWIAAARSALFARAAALDAVLARHGLRALGVCPLFRLVEAPDAAELFERLARRAILTRPFAHNPHWLRLGLPPHAAALGRLDAALGHG